MVHLFEEGKPSPFEPPPEPKNPVPVVPAPKRLLPTNFPGVLYLFLALAAGLNGKSPIGWACLAIAFACIGWEIRCCVKWEISTRKRRCTFRHHWGKWETSAQFYRSYWRFHKTTEAAKQYNKVPVQERTCERCGVTQVREFDEPIV